MMSALRIAATGMHAQQMNVDVLSNNISNLNTTGYKRQVAAFRDLIYQDQIGVGAITSNAGTIAPTGAQTGLGVKIGAIYSIMEPSNVTETTNAFDLAIQGRGFFQVTQPNGDVRFTRDGAFQIDANGSMVTKEGFTVDPNIVVPTDATEVSISESGVVSAKVGETISQIGQITLVMFTNESGLSNEGANYFGETEASGTPSTVNPTESGSGGILQGFLETSNVDPIRAVTQLISAQRAYELNSRVISTADEMLNAVNQIS
jgi:flagellar basal-body rod protein FlgG